MSLAMSLLKVLPESLRHSVIRSRMAFEEREIRNVTVKVADAPEEILAASHILYRAYAKRGLIAPHPSRVRVSAHGVLPTTRTFVAKVGDKYVGTLSLVVDGALGLPMDGVYPEVATYRARGERLAEVGSLALLPSFRRKGIACLLYRLMYERARDEGVDRLLAAVHPDAEDIYRATLLFERFGGERRYAGLNSSARAVALTLDLRTAPARYAATFGHLPPTTANPYYVYVTSHRPEIQRAGRAGGDVDHASMVRPLVAARHDVFAALSSEARIGLRGALPNVRFTIPDVDAHEALGTLASLVPA